VGLLALFATGCGGPGAGGADRPESSVVDSAGVRVVENRRPPGGGLRPFAVLSEEPVWSLNAARGAGQYGRPTEVRGAATLSDGRVAVADAGSFRVRFLRSDGEVWSMGGRGGGPGRFMGILGMGLGAGDTVWVSDPVSHEVTLVDPAGVESLEARLPMEAAVVGRFGDGSFLAVRPRPADAEEEARDRVVRDSVEYLRWSPLEGDTARVGLFPGGERLTLLGEEGEPVTLEPPLARGTSLAVGPGRIYLGDQERFEILGLDPDGTLRQVIRLTGADRSVDEELLATLSLVGPDGREPPWADRFWSHAPETLPAFGRLLLDRTGHLWVAQPAVGREAPTRWWVFSPDGVLRGGVDVPAGLVLLEVGPAHVLGVVPSAMGPELRRYRLERRRG
jgi:hypothetical protein